MLSRVGLAVSLPTLTAWKIGAPAWAQLALLALAALLAAAHVTVTQVIRLRASARITDSRDALRVLEIEDRPRAPRPVSNKGALLKTRDASAQQDDHSSSCS